MKTLFEAATVDEVKARIALLRPDSERQWGKMTAAQTLAHCSIGVETATGERKLPRMFIGRILGSFVKGRLFKNDDPMRKNSPTAPELVVGDERDLVREQERLSGLIDRFVNAGAAGCTSHPHTFFGKLTPQEWAALMYKHVDHHLRQFGV